MRRGHTLIEVLVASTLLGVVLTTLLSVWQMLDRVSASQASLREGRQAVRTMLTFLVSDIQNAVLIWTGTNTVNGRVYQVPQPGPAAPARGTDLLYAVPEVASVCCASLTYTVCGVHLQPTADPQSQEVVCERFAGLQPARPNEPATIDLTALTSTAAGYTIRTFPASMPNADWVSVLLPPRGVYFDVTFLRTPPDGSIETEHLTTEATMRNY